MLDKKQQAPQLCVFENDASNTIKESLIHESIHYQLVPPKEYRVNVTKRAIQTTIHVISGLCSTDITMGPTPTLG